jgi:transposase-like protein
MTTRGSRTRSRYRRGSAREKTQYLAAYRRSGETVRGFCARVGVPRSTFALWRREARARHAAATRAPSRFAQVQVVPSPTAPAVMPLVVIRAPHGLALEVVGLDVATLVAVLRGVVREDA